MVYPEHFQVLDQLPEIDPIELHYIIRNKLYWLKEREEALTINREPHDPNDTTGSKLFRNMLRCLNDVGKEESEIGMHIVPAPPNPINVSLYLDYARLSTRGKSCRAFLLARQA